MGPRAKQHCPVERALAAIPQSREPTKMFRWAIPRVLPFPGVTSARQFCGGAPVF